ncbi:MAG: metallophosphoesterase [Armatimonadetes bacterium]|jgi:predicted MPP superfamily phosphohydrolase|nr:metallophosphoesterase [Armatimonadota bacterium]
MTADLVGGAAVAGVLLAAYAGALEPRWLQVTRRDIALPCIPEALRGLTVAHLSDIHYGRLLAPRLLEALITRTNALQPDLIALTGDFVDQYPHEVEPIARELGRLRARLGVWAVLGGHDITAGERAFRRAFAANGIHLLRNEAAPVVAGATPLWVVGVRDNSEYYLDRLDAALASVPEGARTILLAHSPDIAWEAAERKIDLVLSGHTHGGQVCAPFYGPIVTESRLGRRFARGLRRAGSTWIYTSRGVGMVRFGVRFLARPEIALHRLTHAD